MKAFNFSLDKRGIGTLVFDLPGEKVNKINQETLEELDGFLVKIAAQKELRALLIRSGKKDTFIVGADLTRFGELFKDHELAERLINLGHRVFWKLSRLPCTTIAIIDGPCLGGGLELALSCERRLVTDSTKTLLGLPEVNLGIFPGWGGTQRLPRLVGLVRGLNMILSGKSINYKTAFKIGLADAVIPYEFKDELLPEYIEKIIVGGRRRKFSLRELFLEKNPLGRWLVFRKAKKNVVQKTKGHYPAPLAALKLVRRSYAKSLEAGLISEKRAFIKGVAREFSRAPQLIDLFFIRERLKKQPGLPDPQADFRVVESAAVIGSGTMGSGITWLFSYRDIPVRMKDIAYEFIGRGLKNCHDIYDTLIRIKKLKPAQANRKFHNIAYGIDYRGFRNADIVIESAIEDIEVKKKIYRELEDILRPDALIATNTSSFTIEELSSDMKYPERFLGMHFFNPPARMPLVEIVAGKKSSPEAVKTAFELCRRLKKTALLVGDCSGFLVNRIFAAAMIEVMRLFMQGVEMEALERALLSFGLPMGPFRLADEVGNDVNFKALKNMEKAYGERMRMPLILEAMNIEKLYGRKSGAGFYLYGGKKRVPNLQVKELLPKIANPPALTSDQINERVIGQMRREAKRCLDEGIIKNPDFLRLGLVYGMGFPPYKQLI